MKPTSSIPSCRAENGACLRQSFQCNPHDLEDVKDKIQAAIEVPRERAQRHAGGVTIGVRPEKVTLHGDAPAESSGRNVVGPGRITDVSFSGVSTQYEVTVPGLGALTVFAQNTSISSLAHAGDEVWLSWAVEHGFGLEDDPATAVRFDDDTDTSMLATQKRQALAAELEEA